MGCAVDKDDRVCMLILFFSFTRAYGSLSLMPSIDSHTLGGNCEAVDFSVVCPNPVLLTTLNDH